MIDKKVVYKTSAEKKVSVGWQYQCDWS